MKSIKRGRGPSMMNCLGSAAAAVFGLIWTAVAIKMGAPFFFPVFGIIFVIVGIIQAVYNYKNATGKNRFSEFDITDENEEPEPFESCINGGEIHEKETARTGGYCPYCGTKTESEYDFCPKCGRKLPSEL